MKKDRRTGGAGKSEYQETMKISEELICLVSDFFKGDKKKTRLWFKLPNPSLGNISPHEMILSGRSDRLLKFVRNQLSENHPPEREVSELDREIYGRYSALTLSRDGWPETFKKYELTTLLANTVLKLSPKESVRLSLLLSELQHLNFRWHQSPTFGNRTRVEKLIRKEEERIMRILRGKEKRSLRQRNWKNKTT